MVAPQSKVKIKMIKDCEIPTRRVLEGPEAGKILESKLHLAGQEAEVDADIAEEFCRPLKGHHTFRGERVEGTEADKERANLTRAVRL